ncbi:MAG: DUF3737 family protein [Clostridia bacterium]|nr:DUF3737 family protein [Clostridia bacterium]
MKQKPRTIISNQQFDQERALYNLMYADIKSCTFAGPADGESALKEARHFYMQDCQFSLRYPLWHVKDFSVTDCHMDALTRAALWYADNGEITHSTLGGIKALRECNNINLYNCEINSAEFGWKSHHITVKDCSITAEYLFLDCSNVRLENVQMKGKYSFQYIKNLEIVDSVLDTKDAFWHSNNVTVRNSTIKGEYLAWFSRGLTLIDCKIIGTQPLCYCDNLTLINCTMEKCDLAFEYSSVKADIIGHIDSVKNARSGIVTADSIGEIICDHTVMKCNAKVLVRGSNR